MKFVYFLFPTLAFAQLDFSIYDEVVLVKTNSVPEQIKKVLDVHPLLNYTEIGLLKYPDNIVRETNILNHLYDNYWPECKSQIEKNLEKICVSDENDILDDMKYLYKIHKQYLKNIHQITHQSNCRVSDPFAYWFKLRLEEYTTQPWFNIHSQVVWTNGLKTIKFKRNPVGIDRNIILWVKVNQTLHQMREITRSLTLDLANCKELLGSQIDLMDNLFDMFYQVFLKERPF